MPHSLTMASVWPAGCRREGPRGRRLDRKALSGWHRQTWRAAPREGAWENPSLPIPWPQAQKGQRGSGSALQLAQGSGPSPLLGCSSLIPPAPFTCPGAPGAPHCPAPNPSTRLCSTRGLVLPLRGHEAKTKPPLGSRSPSPPQQASQQGPEAPAGPSPTTQSPGLLQPHPGFAPLSEVSPSTGPRL